MIEAKIRVIIKDGGIEAKVRLEKNRKAWKYANEFEFGFVTNGWEKCLINGWPDFSEIEYNGKTIPINELILHERETEAQKKEERNLARKEAERLQEALKKSDLGHLLPKDTRKVLAFVEPKSIDSLHQYINLALPTDRPKSKESKDELSLARFKNQSFQDQGLPDNMEHTARELLGEALTATLTCKTSSRLALGLGGGSVYETGLTLHHVYGIPYIPASSVKGAARSWIIQQVFDGKESLAIKNQRFCDLFGCPSVLLVEEGGKKNQVTSYYEGLGDPSISGSRQGCITFFDAFPVGEGQVEKDIMTPHYGDYYTKSDDTPPADYLEPSPIEFLTVAANTKFKFILGQHRNLPLAPAGNTQILGGEGDSYLAIAFHWLELALLQRGIGAKTAVGYGFMEKV
ncbi:type III-B CRISPR module RAMP protein Cmr6 [Pontibacter sp. G13]|uniref:type III-B CRISPR module RAMP protein Cmr6 n=1 Tax=Pontibacter sp. G13 TaxID=3074898 RepID=UPI00288BB5D9|nr:type III-B CRISPR module RAMP protein Cmr6 [Pontibacter sp. G13]WNJ18628.1 type III-B CRISPR module RAMP protein Cmr6 [Pontibacter sp. G13]